MNEKAFYYKSSSTIDWYSSAYDMIINILESAYVRIHIILLHI